MSNPLVNCFSDIYHGASKSKRYHSYQDADRVVHSFNALTEFENHGKTHAEEHLEPFNQSYRDRDDADGDAGWYEGNQEGATGYSERSKKYIGKNRPEVSGELEYRNRHKRGGCAALSAVQATRHAARRAFAAHGHAARLRSGCRSVGGEHEDE